MKPGDLVPRREPRKRPFLGNLKNSVKEGVRDGTIGRLEWVGAYSAPRPTPSPSLMPDASPPPPPCPFCHPPPDRLTAETPDVIALPDRYPVSPGHTLVVPRAHVASVFDLPADTQAEGWRMVTEVRARLEQEHRPDGFNIGVNDGVAAGQTVAHAHVHVIPRFEGDVADPRGGVRWVVPERAPYWEP